MYFRLLIVLLALTIWPVNVNAESKVGIIDGDRLFDDYKGAQDATKKIADAQDDLKNLITESEKIYSEFEKQKKSEAEKLTKQKELQVKIDIKAKETRRYIESLSKGIEQDILQTIKTIATKKGLNIVFDKRAVLYGGDDITQLVLEELKKKIPIAKDTKESDSDKETN